MHQWEFGLSFRLLPSAISKHDAPQKNSYFPQTGGVFAE
jgi:hypothetical protein